MVDHQIEFHRNAAARMPASNDRRPGVAFYVHGNPSQQFCTCLKSKRKTCAHLKALQKVVTVGESHRKGPDLEERFRNSIWHMLADILSQGDRLTAKNTKKTFVKSDGQTMLRIAGPEGKTVVTYLSASGDRNRLAERLGAFTPHDQETVPDRFEIISRLKLLTLTDAERQLHDLNRRSRRQAIEDSIWFGLAYHCFLEFGDTDCQFVPSVDEASGTFMVTCQRPGRNIIFHAAIPRQRVRALLNCFRRYLPNQHGLPIHPIPLKSLFRVSRKTEIDLDVYPVIQLLQAEGEERFFSREDLERFIYGDLVYIPELKIFAELERPDRTRRFNTPRKMTFKRYQIPSFLEAVGDVLDAEEFVVDPDVKGLRLLRRWNSMRLTPSAIDRDWCWLDIKYGYGDESISLMDIIDARRASTRYIGTSSGWVDTQTEEVEMLTDLTDALPADRFHEDGRSIKVSHRELFQLSSLMPSIPQVDGTGTCSAELSRLLALEPTAPPPDPELTSRLRQYQWAGLNWLWWLWENRFGGLLCDDMGLGKTHQIMALMSCIRRERAKTAPFLVVCPTTVISHWEIKLEQHTPTLQTATYYGGDRNLSAALEDADVLITSYGLLRNDIDRLNACQFALIVFDEIQYIKNTNTKTHAAALALTGGIKIGLSGTPIENTIWELKALLDVTAPGYLGTNKAFSKRFLTGNDKDTATTDQKRRLRRLIYPFILRRVKDRVLDELPEKIEDIRFCELTEPQVKLYRDALDARSKGILDALRNEDQPVPYMHIFALLTLLKQICNHPALLNPQIVDDAVSDSGKWALFKELLEESLASEQKVVVYSQFTGMIDIITGYLDRQGIGHVALTGRSRHRGRLIDRFNTDPACRVFVGSLRAGGTGIDLVAGSVVIHYDRWWNAAKEDQATDRVHRIGQKRGVQVFKLVTLGTLEEKIAAMIDKKRELAADIVREDDPGVLKSFTRRQLMAFLS